MPNKQLRTASITYDSFGSRQKIIDFTIRRIIYRNWQFATAEGKRSSYLIRTISLLKANQPDLFRGWVEDSTNARMATIVEDAISQPNI